MSKQKKMITKACAKVNLTFEMLGHREDGFHDIVSILQAVDLNDTITLSLAQDITISCNAPLLLGPDNLAFKAAELLKDSTGYSAGVTIDILKSIPVAAGLGGGSSDAAAVLLALNDMWGLKRPINELTNIAEQLWSDVPFFLHRGTAMASGRGEKIRPLPDAALEWILIVSPDISVEDKTREAFKAANTSIYTKGALTRKLEARIRVGKDVPPQFRFNAFDGLAEEIYPGIKDYKFGMESLGLREIHLCGSGPSLFSIVNRREIGSAIQLLLSHTKGINAYLVRTVGPVEKLPS